MNLILAGLVWKLPSPKFHGLSAFIAIYHNIPWYLHHFQTHPDTFGLFRAKCQEHHGCLVRDWQHSRLLNDFICGSPAFSRRHNETYSVNHEYPQTISLVLLLLMDWMEGTSRGKHGFYHQVRGFLQNYPERDPLIVRICYCIWLDSFCDWSYVLGFFLVLVVARSASSLLSSCQPCSGTRCKFDHGSDCWKLNISRDGGFQRWSTPKSSKLLLCLYSLYMFIQYNGKPIVGGIPMLGCHDAPRFRW